MSGTVWPSLVAGARAKASEVEGKFDWIEGDIVPMTGGTKTDDTYDLGQSSFRWRDGYFSRQVIGGFGSVGVPSFTFGGRTTDGWYSPASNHMGLALGGSQFINHRDNSGTTITDGGQSYTYGIDPADSNAYKISIGSDLATVTAIKIDTSGRIFSPKQPAFLAYMDTSSISNVTGAGTYYTFTTRLAEQFDYGSNFSDGVFTVPVDGVYAFQAGVRILSPTNTSITFELLIGNSITAVLTGSQSDDASAVETGMLHLSTLMDLNAGDRIMMVVRAVGASATDEADITDSGGVGVYTTRRETFFSGYFFG